MTLSEQGYVSVEGGRVWYERVGTGPGIPLLVLHGGPGSSHVSLRPLMDLADVRSVIFYDQLGCGKSDRPDDPALWSVDRFVRELAAVRQALQLDDVHILGHSWGTMLLFDYLLQRPTGVHGVIFSSPCLSASRWVADANRYREELPADVQSVLVRCEADGTTGDQAYEDAAEAYMNRHVCRVDVSNAERQAAREAFGKDVYHAMWGPSEFYPTGSLKTYERVHDLNEISHAALFTCGEYDEASPASTQYYHEQVPGSRFEVLAGCSHSPLRENPEPYLRLIRAFLRDTE